MKYTLKQRLDIGRRIYEGELTRFQAAEEYGINDNTARNYMWLYRDTNHLPPKNAGRKRKTDASNSSSYPGTYHRGTIKKRLRSEGGWFGNSLQQ